MDRDLLIRLGKQCGGNGVSKEASFIPEALSSMTQLAALAPVAVGGAGGYLYNELTEPDKDDYEALRQREKIELYRQLAAHANMRADRLLGKNRNLEDIEDTDYA